MDWHNKQTNQTNIEKELKGHIDRAIPVPTRPSNSETQANELVNTVR